MERKSNFRYFISITLILIYGPLGTYRKRNSEITPVEIIRKEGFPSETHLVTTDDGYILTVYRIPGAKGSTPVFLQHGLFDSSAAYLYNGKNGSLAFLLHQMGYDVWLGNSRGNTYSKAHKTLATSDPLFWNFSWDELGLYDAPAVVAYVYKKTNEKMFFIGHSMGCTIFSVMAIERPDVAENIKAMFALAPAVFATHNTHPLLRLIVPFWREILFVSDSLGIHSILGRNVVSNFMADFVCSTSLMQSLVCDNLLFFVGGFNRPELPKGLTPQVMGRSPAGTSVRVFAQYLQQMELAKLRHFNYPSKEKNLEMYNSPEPTEYNISKIQVPVAVFYSSNDRLVGPQDAERFYEKVPNKLGIYKIEPYNHFDFLLGLHAPKRVFSTIFKLMSQFE